MPYAPSHPGLSYLNRRSRPLASTNRARYIHLHTKRVAMAEAGFPTPARAHDRLSAGPDGFQMRKTTNGPSMLAVNRP